MGTLKNWRAVAPAKGSSPCLAPNEDCHVGMEVRGGRPSYFLRDALWTDWTTCLSVGSGLQAFGLQVLPRFMSPHLPVSVPVLLEALRG